MEPDTALTARVVVAPVELSVIVSVPVADPVVRVQVADVSVVTVGVLMLHPETPDTENSVEAVSVVQSVCVPVSVRPVEPLTVAVVGLTARVAVDTVMVCVTPSPSVMVSVPVD